MSFKDTLLDIETLIKAGSFTQARQKLSAVNIKKIPRFDVEKTANLAYRCNMPNLSIRILGSFMGDRRGIHSSLNESETAEYAIALSRLGATREAKSWLDSLKSLSGPKPLLYKSFIHITEWEYDKALELLQKYLDLPEITDYQSLVAKTNLAAAHVFLQNWKQAETLLKQLIEVTKSQEHTLLLSNAYELSAQACLFQKQFPSAQKYLNLGRALSQKSGSSAELYLQKWSYLLGLYLEPNDMAFDGLMDVRKRSWKMGLWESVRECDFYFAKFHKDKELLHFVFFGTPHDSYRNNFMTKLERPLDVPESFVFSLSSEPRRFVSGSVFDVSTLCINDQEKPLAKPGSLFDKLIHALTSDFYRPQRLGSLFTHLYPDEYYDPLHSPDRIHQVMKRFRQWIHKNKLPLDVDSSEGTYRLQTKTGIFLKKPIHMQQKTNDELLLERLHREWGDQPFSLKQAQHLLEISQTKTFYLIQPEIGKKLVRTGNGPATKYRFSA